MAFSVKALARRVARPDTAVGAGILVSRFAGLLRVRLIAREFGQNSIAVDAFNAAFRIPNLLQNLFGEGALSGSFIPVHSALRARGEHEAAAQTARTFFALLTLAIAILVLLGVTAAPLLVDVVAPGFSGPKRDLAIRLVRILFPGAGILVASAWCLGVLNSHGRFLLAYTAPVAWNAAMIGTLLLFGGRHDLDTMAIYLAWGSVVGSLLQFARAGPPGVGADPSRPAVRPHRARPAGHAQFHACPGQPRRGPAHRIHRHDDREPAPDRRGDRLDQRADSVHDCATIAQLCFLTTLATLANPSTWSSFQRPGKPAGV